MWDDSIRIKCFELLKIFYLKSQLTFFLFPHNFSWGRKFFDFKFLQNFFKFYLRKKGKKLGSVTVVGKAKREWI